MSEKHGPNGFLLGLLIGGAVGALIGTKKGRQILKDVAEYGLEYVGNTINMNDIETILDEDEEEMMGQEMDEKNVKVRDVEVKESQPARDDSRRKRLFRGIRKK